MKEKKFLIFHLALLVSILIYSQKININVFEADFSNPNRDAIYEINCHVGIATIFELPKGKSIAQFVLGDPASWKFDCDGIYGIVSPKRTAIKTSLTIITTDGELYTFLIQESQTEAVGKVRILIMPSNRFFKTDTTKKEAGNSEKEHTQTQPGPETFEQVKARCLSSKHYKIGNNVFKIENVVDDGIFSYLLIKSSQIRPAIFVNGDGQGSGLEPLRYYDKGDYYVIHRVLQNKMESFVLKLGKTESSIKLK